MFCAICQYILLFYYIFYAYLQLYCFHIYFNYSITVLNSGIQLITDTKYDILNEKKEGISLERSSEKIERHIALDLDRAEDYPAFEMLGKALSSDIRLKILFLLKHQSMNIVELAEELNIPVSSTAFHVNLLEKASLINTEILPGVRGSQKVSSSRAEDVFLALNTSRNKKEKQSLSIDMPIGNYFDFRIHPTCGMINNDSYIEACDDVKAFYSPNRCTAQLIWFQKGFIEYRFPNHFLNNLTPSYLSFSLELCSEAPGYRNNWPSDITFSLNDRELLTYTSPGDFGGRHGKLTPAWWTEGNTQFGLLKNISIDKYGVSLDGIRQTEKLTIDSLNLYDQLYISFKIEIKEDAKHIGGINIFGKSYGDYPQNIVMHIDYLTS